MNDDLINEEGFDCFFTENDMLRQHCRLLETELAELHGELKEGRSKIATLVLMWSGVSRELANAEAEIRQVKEALEATVHEIRERDAVTPNSHEADQAAPLEFGLTYGS